MIFAKSFKVSEDPEAELYRTDVVIKVDNPVMMPKELKSVLSTAINDTHTDLNVSEQIAKILDEAAEELATHVRLLMEGE